MLNHNYIGTEHLLLGLVHDGEGVAAQALTMMSVSLEAVRQQVEEIIGQGGAGRAQVPPVLGGARRVRDLSNHHGARRG